MFRRLADIGKSEVLIGTLADVAKHLRQTIQYALCSFIGRGASPKLPAVTVCGGQLDVINGFDYVGSLVVADKGPGKRKISWTAKV